LALHEAAFGDRIYLSESLARVLRSERAVLTSFPNELPPNEHLDRVLHAGDFVPQVKFLLICHVSSNPLILLPVFLKFIAIRSTL
jgi:hypothetical protein